MNAILQKPAHLTTCGLHSYEKAEMMCHSDLAWLFRPLMTATA